MNRFEIVPCMEVKENGYSGPCVMLACVTDPSFVLFFPVSSENAKIINFVLKEDETKYDINTSVLGIYKTMVESWKLGDRYLAGVIMDTVFNEEFKDDVLSIRMVLCDHNGELDSLVYVNFVHAMLLAAMEQTKIIVSEKLLSKMMSGSDDEEDGKKTKNNKSKHNFPEDKKIVEIAKKIMSGKIKDS